MTEQLTKLVVNCATGEEQIVPLSEEELAQREKDILEAQQRMQEEEARREQNRLLIESAKNKLISGQPLTEEEAGILLQGMANT